MKPASSYPTVFPRDAPVACHMDDRGVLAGGRPGGLGVRRADPVTTPRADLPEVPVGLTVVGGVARGVGARSAVR